MNDRALLDDAVDTNDSERNGIVVVVVIVINTVVVVVVLPPEQHQRAAPINTHTQRSD